ncbi:uncharacterized protein LOC113108082 [Carassius auratus]|uniref:Uncharacterized protein LOC113108082 n=1 Tax=Carassius auratus TaxID=7957 RepID=A0A6P6Q385_CARAU|nr:uncharacterized protein LOC113108082 [Carassius auratus]
MVTQSNSDEDDGHRNTDDEDVGSEDQFKVASEEERGPLAELRSIIHKKLMTLRRAEGHRRRRKERSRRRAAFLANPFGFTKQLLGQKRSGQLTCSKAEVDHHLKQSYIDEYREQDLGPCRFLINPPAPALDFDGKEPGWKEIQEVVRRARENSAPGPSGVPHKVYKNCPRLLHRLWKILKVIWRRRRVADQWRQAEGVWIPKEEKSQKIDQFRAISLLSVEGKIFFSLISRRLTDYLLKNSYIDTSVQKGGTPGVPGCLEHTGVVTQLIREARENKGDLAVLWLDLANAYGSIPHKLVEEALNRHHTPKKFRDLILDYYANFHLRVSSGTTTSDWHKLEKGIITSCTISVILFALAMNMLVKSAEIQCRGEVNTSCPGHLLWPVGNGAGLQAGNSLGAHSVEGKIFFSLISRRLTDYLLKNSYIDTSVQKGGTPGVPGCLEHTGVVTQLIREARENKGDLAVLWLDLANAYGSIPHKLAEEALNRHHTPKKFRDLILDYYANFHLKKYSVGEKSTPAARGTSSGLLATARDWELSVDLGKQLKFPEAVAITTLRPDVVLTSEASKQVILLELTVPWEDRMEEANERKRAKYSQLVEDCRSNGWRAICQLVEVGCRGFVGQSLCRAYKMLGITGASQRRAIKLATDAAEVASRWLWIRRGEAWRVG